MATYQIQEGAIRYYLTFTVIEWLLDPPGETEVVLTAVVW
jgi:hypothetical protein